jgi:hypothetical protein
MIETEAKNLMEDIQKTLTFRDYCKDVYINCKNIGTRRFKSCAYYDIENWLFIWDSIEGPFIFNKDDSGDIILITSDDPVFQFKKA